MNIFSIRRVSDDRDDRSSQKNVVKESKQREAQISAIKGRIGQSYDNINRPIPLFKQLI